MAPRRRSWSDLLLLTAGLLLVTGGMLMGYLVTVARGMPHGPARTNDLADFSLVVGPLVAGLGLVTWAVLRMRRRSHGPR